ncbi:MAG: sulfurtransferase complex subunit TusB [Candidatus Thorarchaeota archaeon]
MSSTILYLYGFSPQQRATLERLHDVITHQAKMGHEVSIILLQDAVVATAPKDIMPDTLQSLISLGVQIYVVGEDLDARGLSDLLLSNEVTRIDYDRLIELVVESGTLCSWL